MIIDGTKLNKTSQIIDDTDNPVYKKYSHESKPIRAGISSLITGVTSDLAGLGVGAMTAPISLAEYGIRKATGDEFAGAKALSNNPGIQIINGGRNLVNKIIGANPEEERDRSERVAAFVGDMIPTIATAGYYGLAKAPAVAGTKLLSKIPTKIANKTIKNIAEYALPGVQIPRTVGLVKKGIKSGLTAEQALKNARKIQTTFGATQVGLSLGLQEGVGYLTDNVGILGDYRNDPEDFSLEQQINDKNSLSFGPLALTALAGFVGYKGLKRLSKKNVAKIIAENAQNSADTKILRQFAPTKNIRPEFRANILDKNLLWDQPEFAYLVDPETKEFITQDIPTTIGAMYKTGNYTNGISTSTSPYAFYKNLETLSKSTDEASATLYKKLENILELENKIQNMRHQILTKGDVGDFVDYDELLKNSKNVYDTTIDDDFKRLRKKLIKDEQLHKKLLQDLETDPIFGSRAKQFLQDVSEQDKALLNLQHKQGTISDSVYKYLLENRTVNGHFSYKPAIPLTEELSTGKRLYKKFKDILTGTDDYNIRGDISGAYRKDFNYFVPNETYLNTFKRKTINTLRDSAYNSMLRYSLPRMLYNQKELYNYFDNEITKALKALPKNKKDIPPELARATSDKIYDLQEKAVKAVRIKYVGAFDPYKMKPTNSVNPLTTNYKPFDITNSATAKHISRKTETSANKLKNVFKGIENNKNYITFWDNGKLHVFETSSLLKSVLDFAPETGTILKNMLKSSRRLSQSMSTGNLNPAFAPTSYIYSLMEGLTALPRISKELGVDYHMFGDSINYVRASIRAGKERNAIRLSNDIINDIDKQIIEGIDDINILNSLNVQKQAAKNKLDNLLLQKTDRLGATTFKYDNDFAGNTYSLAPHAKISEQLYDAIGRRFGDNTEHAIKFVNFLQETLRNAGNDALLIHFAGKRAVQATDDAQIRQIANTISQYITDSKKTGLYQGLPGEMCGIISNYVPYGRVMISSIGAKIEALNVKNGVEFMRSAYRTVKNSNGLQKKGIDLLTEVQIGIDALKNNAYLQGLILTAGLPEVACYVWNHSTDNNMKSYYSLSDYDKSSKYILTNFLGQDNHLSIPVDQEVMIFGKIVETILDSYLGGSQLQNTDPAFDNNRLMLLALQRSLNIENLVPIEAAVNLAGYRTNFGPSNFTGDPLISPLPPNQTNLDGSKTTIQDGIFSQESKAFINTMFGAIGNALTNGIEQAHIGTRDVGIAQGAEDFVKGAGKSLFKNVPFVPVGSKFTFSGANQTQKSNKLRQNTIDQLRKLRSYVENDNNATFGRRKEGKLANDAMLKGLSPELQNTLLIANVAVPYYNENIAPLYDKISATYKQIASFNATGRDRNGNIVDAGNRFTYQQQKNLEIQQIHGQIFDQFKKLEQILTTQFNRDITLDRFNKLQ